jgi:hypothetical protein
MRQRLRANRVLVVFVFAYFVLFIVIGLVTNNPAVPFYAGFVAVLVMLVAWWDARHSFSPMVLWGLAVWGALHLAGGLIPIGDATVLYNTQLLPFLRFDQLVHAFGFGFAGLAFWEAQRPETGSGAFLAFMGGVGFGGINEMVEFLITRIVAETNIGGFENTGWDLVANTIGAALAALWVAVRDQPSDNPAARMLPVDIKAIAARWADAWQRGWPAKDVEAMAAFYSPEATYLSVPFREPDRGVEGVRGYLNREFGVESHIECWFRIPVVEGNRAAIEWWASWLEDGKELTLAGSTFLRFDDKGLIVDHRDYWNQASGRLAPYENWNA